MAECGRITVAHRSLCPEPFSHVCVHAFWASPLVHTNGSSFCFSSSETPLSFCKSRSIFPFKYQDLSRAMCGRAANLSTVLPTPAQYWSLWNLKTFALFYSVLDLRSKFGPLPKTLYSSFCALLFLERAASEESCEAKELEPTEAIGKWRANGWSYRARNQESRVMMSYLGNSERDLPPPLQRNTELSHYVRNIQ